MTWEEYERALYAEVLWLQRRDAVMRAISTAIGNRSQDWEGWPGSLRLANEIMKVVS